MNTILSIEELTVRFRTPQGEVPAVEEISLQLEVGEIFAILGETGCGKSVLGRTIMRLPGENALINGTIRFKDQDILSLSEKELSHIRGNAITIIMQNPELALNPVLTIGRQLMESLKHHRKIDSSQAKAQVTQSLEQMGFDESEEILNKYPFQMSGGMNQRILTAAAMLMEPELLIADEPTRALDDHLKEAIKKRLAACRDDYGTSILLITHDLELAGAIAQRVGVMYAGEFVEINPMSSFLKEPKHPYSQSLIKSYSGQDIQREPEEPENSPLLTIPSNGCHYAPRCPFKMLQCLTIKPDMISLEKGEVRCLLYTS